jgi:hypothetical protein
VGISFGILMEWVDREVQIDSDRGDSRSYIREQAILVESRYLKSGYQIYYAAYMHLVGRFSLKIHFSVDAG